MSKHKDLVFIISGGRTGTTFFGQRLSLIIDDCFSVHEPDLKYGWDDRRTWKNIGEFGIWHMVVGRALGLTGAMPTALQYLSGQITHDEAVQRVRAGRVRYHQSIEEPLIVEANPQWSSIPSVLRSAFPQAKIVIITREQQSWVQSWLRKGDRHSAGDRVSPAKRLTPVTLSEADYLEKWPSMTPKEKLHWEWNFLDVKMRSFASIDPLTKLFSYEELFLADGAAMQDLLAFAATHESRTYDYQFEPALLTERVNAA